MGNPILAKLKNIKVNLISILTDDEKPANGESVIIKSDGSYQYIVKAEKVIDGLLYCTVMKSDDPDTDGHITSKEEVKKAFESFKGQFDENHSFSALPDVILKSTNFDENTGKWSAVIDISKNDHLMQKAIDGKINGVSIAGIAKVEPVENGIIKSIMKWAKETFVTKSFESNLGKEKLWTYFDALRSSLCEHFEEDSEDRTDMIKKDLTDFSTTILNIYKKPNQGETEMNIDEVKELIKSETAGKLAEIDALKTENAELKKQLDEAKASITEIAKSRKTTEGGNGEQAKFSVLMKSKEGVSQLEKMKTENPDLYNKIYSDFIYKREG